MKKRKDTPEYRNPSRYRLDFIKENSFGRLWSVRMTRAQVWLYSFSAFAVAVLFVWVLTAYTPVRRLLPGVLPGDLRADYLSAAVKLDSLEFAAGQNAAYINNIASLLRGEVASGDSAVVHEVAIDDSLLAASDAERQFVRSYESQERFNLSVLAPIAAEGMVFASPVGSVASMEPLPTKGLLVKGPRNTPVSVIYRGTVVSATIGADGYTTVTVQHPNDFVSVYGGLGEVLVDRGDRVAAGQRLGYAGDRATVEMWHKGTALDPMEYILP